MALEAEPTYAPLDLPDLGDPSTKQLQHPQISPEGFDHPFESCNPWDPLFPGFDPLAPTLPRAQQQLNFEYECIDQSNRAHPLLDVSAPPPLSFQSLSLASPLPSLYAPARRSRTRTRRRKTISNPELIAPIVAASHLLWLRERECLLKSPNSLKTFQSRHLDTRIALARFRLPTGVLLYAKLDIVWVSGLFQCRLKIDVVAQLRHRHAESVEVFAVPNNFWQDQLITDTLTPLASFSEYWATACTPNLLLLTAALQQRKRERVPRTKRPAAKSAGPSVSNVNSFVFTTR